MFYGLSLDLLVEEEVGVVAIELGRRTSTIVIPEPAISFDNCRVVAMHQTANMVDNGNQLIFFSLDDFVLC